MPLLLTSNELVRLLKRQVLYLKYVDERCLNGKAQVQNKKLLMSKRGFEQNPSSLIGAPQALQDSAGYLSREAIVAAVQRFEVPVFRGCAFATFYQQFRLKPSSFIALLERKGGWR